MNYVQVNTKTLYTILGAILLTTACDAGDSTGSLNGDAGTQGGSSSISADCNSVVNAAPTISNTAVAQNPPLATGGIIPNGTYFLTQLVQYSGPGGSTVPTIAETIQETVVISSSSSNGALLQFNETASAMGSTIMAEMNGTIAISGTSLTITMTCSTVATFSGQAESYSIQGSQFSLYDGSTVPNVTIATYTLQ